MGSKGWSGEILAIQSVWPIQDMLCALLSSPKKGSTENTNILASGQHHHGQEEEEEEVQRTRSWSSISNLSDIGEFLSTQIN